MSQLPPEPEGPNPYQVELMLAAALERITDQQTAAITMAWARAWSEVSVDLVDAVTEVLADAGRMSTMAVVRYQRLAQILAAIADVLEDLTAMAGLMITDSLGEVLSLAEEGTARLIAAQLVDDNFEARPVAPDALTAIVRRTTQQVTSTLQPLADDTYSLVLRELTRGVAAGENPRATAVRMVDDATDMSNFGMNRALNVARTETLDAYREGARVSQLQHDDVLYGWVWIAHLGPRTCRSCLAMHGEVFTLAEAGPHDHQQGRCARTPVVKNDDGEPDLDWIPDAIEHLMSLPVADQKAILGKKGYTEWLAGRFPPEMWVQMRNTPGWRPSFHPAPPPGRRPWLEERAIRRAVGVSV